ncbi:MAG: Hsp20 family protein [Labilithrix sp.]|nr:Hsp20 family protein [Labilithrix sp.]
MLDRLLDDVMTGVTGTSFGAAAPVRSFTPAMDVRANEEEIVFVADVPGFKQEDLEITLDDGALTIKGQRRYEGDGKDKVWLGRSYGSFARSFTLPETVDPDRLSAELADGVLTVRIAQQPKAKPRRIAITPRQLRRADEGDATAK